MNKLLIIVFILFSIVSYSQKEDSQLLRKEAYSKMISEKLNYLILGETSPQQGIGVTLKDDKSNLKLSGLLTQWKGSLLTFEADFSTTSGVYFFDEEDGGKSSKVSLNLFKEIYIKGLTGSKYISNKDESFFVKHLLIDALLKEKAGKFNFLSKVIKKEKLPINDKLNQKTIDKLKELFKKYKLLTDYKVDDTFNFDSEDYIYKKERTNKVYNGDYDDNGNKKAPIDITSIYNIKKAYLDYRKIVENINKKAEEEIDSLEIETVKDHWTSHKISFLGFKTFYERESFKRFTYDPSLEFTKMFGEEKGDLFGGELSFNYAYTVGKRNKQRFFTPDNMFLKVTASLNRASNFSNFSESSLSGETSIGNDVNGIPISTTKNESAFIGDASYRYGFGSGIDIDFYYFPRKNIPVGLFLEFAHRYVSFNSDKIDDVQLTPLRMGLLFNLKNKTKDKPLVTISTFLDRTDLSKSPNEPNNDLRFGLGVGIPVNFK